MITCVARRTSIRPDISRKPTDAIAKTASTVAMVPSKVPSSHCMAAEKTFGAAESGSGITTGSGGVPAIAQHDRLHAAPAAAAGKLHEDRYGLLDVMPDVLAAKLGSPVKDEHDKLLNRALR